MPDPILYETPRSQKFRQDAASGSLTRELIVLYTRDPVEVREMVLSSTPTYFLGLSRKSIDVQPLGAADLWVATVEYGVSAVPDGLRPDQLSFKITAHSAHINQSLNTVYRLLPGDCNQAGKGMRADATDNTLVTPDGYTPTAADVGRIVNVTGGDGWAFGTYMITAVVGGKWKLDRAPAAAGATGGQWEKGGSVAGGTNLQTDGADPTLVTPDGVAPSESDVGQSVVVTGGEGWTVGSYPIVVAYGRRWTLNIAPAAAGKSGGIWHLSGTAPDYNGAIGVTLDAVQGCEIEVPLSEFTYSTQRSSFTWDYYLAMRSLVGKTNDKAAFGKFAPHTLKYLGCEPSSATGQLDDGSRFTFWNLAHSFRHEPDVEQVRVGNITVPVKRGHEYLWARYEPFASGTAMLQRPSAVYVERVVKSGDFSQLEIPGL